ncbi:MAG TPA: hypothetical protein VIF64_03660 [Pyrinomonadaceae bacterium]
MIESKEIKNPFPGLRPFETDEYRLFFGREGQSDALIARLQRSHFLAVVGTSGSGKSSLVRAGLLPSLRGGLMAGAGSGWRIAIMRPGSDPIGNLALALADKDVLLEAGGGLPPAEVYAVIEATLRRGSLGLVDVARKARLAEHEKLLLVVDQFEELFRYRGARGASTGDDASAFVKLLLEAAQQSEFSIYVVPTMRSDFLGDCAQFQGLPEAINDGQYLIPRMTRDERRFAITGPVGVTRGKITEPLVSRLMNDVGDNPDQLPILQHALMRTWDYWAAHRRNGEPIGLEHYEAVGTMTDALSEHADEAFNELPDDRSRQIAEILFKALTERGADNREIRRPTSLKDICEIADASTAEVGAVIEVFRRAGRSFLMPPAEVPLQPETIIDISHESLIRNWRRLKEWVKDEADSARIYRRLAGAATDYRTGAGGLLDDVTLQYVLRWREKSKPDHAWGARYHPEFDDAMAYLEESRAARDARIAAERERERRELETAHAFAEKQARSARRMRRLTAALFLILLFAVGTAAYALHARSDAKRSEKEAKELAARLQVEKTQTELLAAGLELKTEETEQALNAESNARELQKKALDAQKLETERANEQSRIAAVNLQRAVIAQRLAEDNAKEIVEAGKRDDLLRMSIQASRREDRLEALEFLKQLKTKLEALQPGATSGQSSAHLTPDRAKQFALDLGWTLSDIGDIYQQEKSYPNAIANYEEALGILQKVLPENSDNPILFGTYHGLGHSNYNLARSGKAIEIYHTKAEDFFKKALAFQQEHRANKPGEVASGHLNLARLYSMSLPRADEAVKHYRLAIGLLRENNADEAHAALKELAQFHRDAGRYGEAEQVYNELITSQEDITIFEFADKGQGIANIYSELADVYRADGKEKEADDVFHVADLIQKVSLKLKRSDGNVELNLDNDLDEMGDAYVKLGKFSDAEVLYNQALDYRKENPNKSASLWKSYDKLTRLYRENLKDDKKAEEYNNRLIELLKDNTNVNRYVDSMVQLAAVYAKDPARYADSEALYTRALGIAMGQDDWQYPNVILYSLGQLYYKQKRVPEREQAIQRRLEVLTTYFKRLTDPARRPKAANTLVSEYLNAIEAAAYFHSNVRKNDAQAEAVFQPAFTSFDYITGNVYNAKVLETYALTLDHYQALLNKQNKTGDALKVADKTRSLRDRLGQFDKIYTQNTPAQQSAATTSQTP